MADVFIGRGVDDDGTEEVVALKVIKDKYGHDTRYLRMFSDEARILARLSHPNVIRTIEYGITSEARFIVMELLAGRTLAEVFDALLERGDRIALPLTAYLCAKIAAGLHAAHELGADDGRPLAIVHRDVNPSNIFLTFDGNVKLIDFGLAKARVRRDQTGFGIVKGKVTYLAPEQLELLPIDRRIDVFALGATLWELVTMKRLFKRDNDLDTLRAIRDCEIPAVTSLVPSCPPALVRIIERALKKDRDERYPTADEMQIDLEVFAMSSLVDFPREITRTLSRLFPGEGSEAATWLDEALTAVVIATAPPPPMPIPVASTSMLAPGMDDPVEIDLAELAEAEIAEVVDIEVDAPEPP